MNFATIVALAFNVVALQTVRVEEAPFEMPKHVRGGQTACLLYRVTYGSHVVVCDLTYMEKQPESVKLYVAFHEACHAIQLPNNMQPPGGEEWKKRELMLEDEADSCAKKWLDPKNRKFWARPRVDR